MKDFESAFELLKGFNFATAKDRENALMLRKWLGDTAQNPSSGPFPLIIITGPTASGKSTLVRRIWKEAATRGMMSADRVHPDMMEDAVLQKSSLALFEDQNHRDLKLEDVELLKQFVMAREWACRPLGQKEEIVRGKCLVVVITGQARGLRGLLQLPLLEEWAIEIRLKAREAV